MTGILKIAYSLLSLGVISGVACGVFQSYSTVAAHRYLHNGLYLLAAESLLNTTVRWIAISAGLFLACALLLLFVYVVCRTFAARKLMFVRRVFVVISAFCTSKTIVGLTVAVVTAMAAVQVYLAFYTDDPSRPDIVLISIDTLRADHLTCYGYPRNTSPNISSFAQDSTVFTNCFVHVPWTLPSHMSLMTSLYPVTHNINGFERLDPAITTLAEYLKNAGYTTIGLASAYWMQPEFGYEDGFDEYVHRNNFSPQEKTRNAEVLNRILEETIQKHKGNNLFLFLHYFDVHSDMKRLPYDAPHPYDKTFSQGYDGDFTGGTGSKWASAYLKYVNKHNIALSEKDRSYIASLYDNGILYMDRCIGDLLDMLKEKGIYENALILITADHGEEFQQHGYFLHSNPVYYDDLVHVPLLIKWPEGDKRFAAGGKESFLVESIDIMPTILEYAGIRPGSLQGESFLERMSGIGVAKEKKHVYGFGTYYLTPQEQYSFVRTDTRKLAVIEGKKQKQVQLFSLEGPDPEQVDIQHAEPDTTRELLKVLREKRSESVALRNRIIGGRDNQSATTDSPVISEETHQQLKALGYAE